ncbi:hypothetical protein [Roseibium litorale]|uniref:Uncharacterized protein n=1 Tax=Roseibium litorale TaxID=2803841 RepID=A0ABR9CST1_9HYPH|nr:hypothetical protein [Roseibium litorale]MBD8893946.1 hypothetical protein [Roseibium litorale]
MAGFSQTGRERPAALKVPGLRRMIVVGSAAAMLAMQMSFPAFAGEPDPRPAIATASAKKFDGRVPEGVKPEGGAEPGADAPVIPDETGFDPPHRFQLVRNGEDVLRIDRQKGTVSVCNKQNAAWRCVPVPLAADAYEAEIVSLNGQIDALKQRVAELEAARGKSTGKSTDGDVPAPGSSGPKADGKEAPGDGSSLAPEDEQELNKVLDFSEKAMRRFFGLMQDLRREMDGEPSSR